MDHFTSGRPLFADDADEAGGHDEGVYEGETAQIVAEIKDLLDTRIRPAVAQDGGDILFNRFDADTGVVWLHMRGACSGCPSSSATLKAGVENMLKHYVPEVTAGRTDPLSRRRDPLAPGAMIVLGLDTCLTACSVAVLDGERVLAPPVEPMARGHQERLAPHGRSEVMAEAGLAFDAPGPHRRHRRTGLVHRPAGRPGLRQGPGRGAGHSRWSGVGALEALAAEARRPACSPPSTRAATRSTCRRSTTAQP